MRSTIWALSCIGTGWTARSAELFPLTTFATPNDVTDVAISADGHYLSEVRYLGGKQIVVVVDLTQGAKASPHPVLADTDDQPVIRWCKRATNSRLVCSQRSFGRIMNYVIPTGKLWAVDADGSHRIALLQNSPLTLDWWNSVVDWNADTPNNILLEGPESLLDASAQSALNSAGSGVIGQTYSTGVAVFKVDVITGQARIQLHSYGDIRHVISDFRGHPRFGIGVEANDAIYHYYVRDEGGHAWRHLLKVEAYAASDKLEPIAIDTQNSNLAYAIGAHEGRDALWSVDLTDQQPPQLVFAHSKVDVTDPLFLKDGTLLGVRYETERSHVFYVNPQINQMMKSVDIALPDTFNIITDATKDLKLLVVKATSDQEPGAYYLFDTANSNLMPLGRGNPSLAKAPLGRMLSISYAARDGTAIPGYLTIPPNMKRENLPLIVMPHGGPRARDEWGYFFLQQFLVSRGYAVLQMNFRGSTGYGDGWFRAAYQDWGGLTYDDIVDGTKWAISSGIADPKRICIVGWSFGGYAALLGATRDSDLFRCAVSISGVSDLSLLEHEAGENAFALKQIGTNYTKLRADSPRRHADAVEMPLLMIHGDLDAQADVDQSRAMASALKSAGKNYQYIEIHDADHQMHRQSDRVQLLTAIEQFLNTNMPADKTP